MKSLLCLGLALCLVGCVTTPAPVKPQEVIVTVKGQEVADVKKSQPEGKQADKIAKTMAIPYTDPELPVGSYLIGDVGYMTLWAYISAADALNLHKTVKVLQYKGIKKLYIILNSGGGSAFDGMAVADLLVRASQEGMDVTVEANGCVASAAVVIFAAGKHRIAAKGTVFMIHDIKLGKMFAFEGRDDLRSQQEMIDIEEDRYNSLISERSKLSKDRIKEMCRRTTWFTAQQALEYGLADEIK